MQSGFMVRRCLELSVFTALMAFSGQPSIGQELLSSKEKQLVQDVVLCYRFAVIKNAVQSCFHEEAVVREAYVLCINPEKKLMAQVAPSVSDPAFPQSMVDGIRDEIRMKMHDLFIESRARSGPNCP